MSFDRKIATEAELNGLLRYIGTKWHELVRDNSNILDIARDPKWALEPGERWPIYVSDKEDPAEIEAHLRRINSKADMDQVEVLRVPKEGAQTKRQGLLYLPHPYVVPGGRFQEMYAWDSFFIFLGLLQDGKLRLAQYMVDNFIYSVEHYGTVPNGNRSYYLTRSQLPFLGQMILRMHAAQPQDRRWLKSALSATERYHAKYTSGGHHLSDVGLERFWDFGPHGSAPPEADSHERDEGGRTPHERIRQYFREQLDAGGIEDYNIRRFYDYSTDTLTPEYYDNDRSMRESGFDYSRRFGPFNASTLDYAPVCLNSLLYQLECDIAAIHRLLGSDGSAYDVKAARRGRIIRELCFDERDGLFYDYNHRTRSRRAYAFGTTFLPLWVGLADPEQAAVVAKNGLRRLGIAGGLASSDRREYDQWDYPYCWAPLQLFAVEGLRRYGFTDGADRLAINFASCVLKVYLKTGELWEKYDASERSEHVVLRFGYPSNEIGFGWSNAVFTRFVRDLDPSLRHLVRMLDGVGTSGRLPRANGTALSQALDHAAEEQD